MVSLSLSSFHPILWVGQISLKMRLSHFTTLSQDLQVGIFSSGPPWVHNGTNLTFTFTRSNMLSFTLKITWLTHPLLLLLFFSKPRNGEEGRFWAKTHSNIQLGELRILALVTGLNLTLVLKLQSLSENKRANSMKDLNEPAKKCSYLHKESINEHISKNLNLLQSRDTLKNIYIYIFWQELGSKWHCWLTLVQDIWSFDLFNMKEGGNVERMILLESSFRPCWKASSACKPVSNLTWKNRQQIQFQNRRKIWLLNQQQIQLRNRREIQGQNWSGSWLRRMWLPAFIEVVFTFSQRCGCTGHIASPETAMFSWKSLRNRKKVHNFWAWTLFFYLQEQTRHLISSLLAMYIIYVH